MDDWRLTNQEKYLKDKVLHLKDYKDRKTSTDHDHCEFCFDRFSEDNKDINRGYCTEDDYYWICPTCYNDFKDLFQWRLQE
jgi:hypothetical protein